MPCFGFLHFGLGLFYSAFSFSLSCFVLFCFYMFRLTCLYVVCSLLLLSFDIMIASCLALLYDWLYMAALSRNILFCCIALWLDLVWHDVAWRRVASRSERSEMLKQISPGRETRTVLTSAV